MDPRWDQGGVPTTRELACCWEIYVGDPMESEARPSWGMEIRTTKPWVYSSALRIETGRGRSSIAPRHG